MKNGSTICLFKWVFITCLFFGITSCDVSKFYFNKRVGFSSAGKIPETTESKQTTPRDSVVVLSTQPPPSSSKVVQADTSAVPVVVQTHSSTSVSRTEVSTFKHKFSQPGINGGSQKKIRPKKTNGFWGPFLMILLLLIILGGFGYLIYLIGIFSFGLTLALALCILIFIGLVTLLSAVFTAILYLYGLILYSIGHSYGKKINPFK